MGIVGRKDSVSGAAEKVSTVDTGGEGNAQLVIQQASGNNNRCLLVHNPCILFCQYPRAVIPMCSGSSGSDEKEHAQDDESRDDDPEGKRVKESKRQGRGWGRGTVKAH